MSLLFRFKNEKSAKIGTMESHIKICRRYGKVFWGQYSNNGKNKQKYISDKMLSWIEKEEDKRIIFFESTTRNLYVGTLEAIYRREDANIPITDMKNYVPEYYREELDNGKNSKVAVWVGVSDLNRIYDPNYLDKVYSNKKGITGGSIRGSFRGQTNRFYVINHNELEITRKEHEEMQWAYMDCNTDNEFIPSFEDKKKRMMRNTVVRSDQQKFRKKVLGFFGGECCISNSKIDVVLEAAHITPFNGKESNTIQNGICLRADIHKLWDAYLISINPDTCKVEISSLLVDTEYEQFKNKEVFKDVDKEKIPQKNTLRLHYKTFKTS